MNLKRKTFIFHSEWLDIALGMREDERFDTLVAIIQFGLTGARPVDIPASIDAVLDYTEEKIQKDYARFTEYIRSRKK